METWLAEIHISGPHLSGAYSLQILLVLRGILNRAVRMRLLNANPIAAVAKPRPKKRTMRILTVDQVRRLAADMPDQAAEVWTLATTGIRVGEMAGLNVGDLDVKRRRLVVYTAVTRASRETHIGETKGHRAREAPVPSHTLALLRAKAAGRPKTAPLLPAPGPQRKTRRTHLITVGITTSGGGCGRTTGRPADTRTSAPMRSGTQLCHWRSPLGLM